MAEMFNSQVPLELQPEAQAISRQQKMAELLMAKGMQATPGQTVAGGVYVPTNPMEHIANLFNAYAGSKGLENVEQQQLQMAKAIREGKTAEQQAIVEKINKGDIAGALAIQDVYGGTKPYQETLIKRSLPESPTSVEEFKYAQQHPEYAGYVFQKARAGAPSVVNQVGASLAGQVGDMLKTSKEATAIAQNTIGSADKILQSTNKAITGPMANARLTALQAADTLGVTGKDDKAKLAATRQLLQETGKLALAAPPKGQGAVSNYERELFTRASSGEGTFTPIELNLIANRAKEAAGYQIQQHNDMINEAQSLGPDVAKISKLYRVNPPQTIQPASSSTQTTPASNKVKFLGFE
jgi:hypothetical protein